jgi:hypothetical protein
MILLTEELRERLLANGRERNADHVQVVKFFNPLGEAPGSRPRWMPMVTPCSVSPISAIPSRAVSRVLEMTSIRLPFGMGIERDILFATDLPISVWAEAARRAGSLRDAERILYHAAQSGRDGA